MPKVVDTRKQRAKELLRQIKNGPSTSFDIFHDTKPTDENIKKSYQLWAESWIIPELIKLIPELKEEKKCL